MHFIRRHRTLIDHVAWTLLGALLGGAVVVGMRGPGVDGVPILLVGIVVLVLFLLTIFADRIR